MRPVPTDHAPAHRPPRSVLVVGAGLAGSQTVAALRQQGFTGRVVLLGAEGVAPYDRPPLSKELLTRTGPAWLSAELGTDLDAADEVHLACAATGLEVTGAEVRVATAARTFAADAAVLATGAHAVVPDGWSGALRLHTAADAAVLRAALQPGARLVVVGAGWIGAEVAGVAAAAGARVTVVEAASSPLAAALGPVVGALTSPWYAHRGVELLTATAVVGVAEHRVDLADGRALHADVVLVAIGARPDSAWIGASLPRAPDGSVAVDQGFRVLGTDAPVVAVGDLARRRSRRHGWVPGGHWDAALRGPATAVASLLAPPRGPADVGPGDPDPAPYVFSTQLGHELGLHGQVGADDDVVLRGDPAADVTALWFAPGTGRLTAALSIDRPRDVAAARRLFAGPDLPDLDRAVAADPGRPLRDALRA